jgi:hypothetical protein
MTIIVEDKRGGMHFLDATTLMRVSRTHNISVHDHCMGRLETKVTQI